VSSQLREAAIHRQLCTDNVRSIIGGQKKRRFSQVGGLAESAKRIWAMKVLAISSRTAGEIPMSRAKIGVFVRPGLRVLTRIRRGNSSVAKLRPSERTAAFARCKPTSSPPRATAQATTRSG